jgi:spore maturation protein CgeB
MRALVVHPGPSFSVADVHHGLVAGLRDLGVQVASFNLDDRLAFYTGAHLKRHGRWVPAVDSESAIRLAAKGLSSALYEFWPDVVIIVSGFFVPPEMWAVLRARPHHVVFWCTESPYEDDRQSSAARYADTVVLNDPLNVDWFRSEVNPRTFFLPHSYDPARHHPGTPDPSLVCDFAFVGTGYPSRIDFLEQIDWTGLTVRLAGNWRGLDDGSPLLPFLEHAPEVCVDNADAARLYRSAAVNANLYRKETSEGGSADGWAIGPREAELAACGAFFLREPRPEGDALFPMLPTFSSVAEFDEQLRWWLAHPERRHDAAQAAHAAVADRTFTATASRLLALVDGHRKSIAAA